LRVDGVIFVSIDDNEVHNLRHLMGEVFGEESFLGCFIWRRRQVPDNRNTDRASTDHEYVLCYKKPEAILGGKDVDTTKYRNLDNDPRGPWYSDNLTGLATKVQRPNLHYEVTDPSTGSIYQPSPTRGWAISRPRFERYMAEKKILWPPSAEGRPRLKRFLSEASSLKTGFSTILDVGFTSDGTREIQEIFGQKVLQFPKPLRYMQELIKQGTTGEDDLIVDFFAGSCTTAHAVMRANREDGGSRRFIMVQLPEATPPGSPASSLGMHTIAEIGKERIRRATQESAEGDRGESDSERGNSALGFKVFKLSRSHFNEWQDYRGGNVGAYQRRLGEVAASPLVEGWQAPDLMIEILTGEGFPLDSITLPEEEVGGNILYKVESDFLEFAVHVCLDSQIRPELAARLSALPEADVFICLDRALTDELKMRLGDTINLHII
jgi:adenine-specific DNA-methyltransferase